MHRINRVLDMAGRSKKYPKGPELNKLVNIQILTLTILTLCILGNFSCFFLRLLIFFKINFSKKKFGNHFQGVKIVASNLFAKVISR